MADEKFRKEEKRRRDLKEAEVKEMAKYLTAVFYKSLGFRSIRGKAEYV